MSQSNLNTLPVGPLGIIAMDNCKELGSIANDYIVKWRERDVISLDSPYSHYINPQKSYLVNAKVDRFGSGEAKGSIKESIRGKDLYILVDVGNYGSAYSLYEHTNKMSPDDHFQDLKRVIAAIGGKARRITVLMPFLYESRQHRRTGRESLDCALALQELAEMGVENIITFDAHDPRVQNAIPLKGFETVQPIYQFIKELLHAEPTVKIDSKHMMVISTDEGGMERAIRYADILGLDIGMFYKRRDYTTIKNGSNPILAHEYLGSDLNGKDVLIIDDMISSGESILKVAAALKEKNANRIFIFSTFGLFTNGLDIFDVAYENKIITKIFTTNLLYQTPALLSKPYYVNVDMSKFIALMINTLNYDTSISSLLTPLKKIQTLLESNQ